ncbi:MAG TPA: carboxypeptidase M32 [candidate division Zixibacteria bacterium]|nr:carboxypeptidase M32 [candidate division Zixibacteria bacterium]
MVKITKEIDLYEKLLSKVKEIVILNNALGVLYWDMETYIPHGGIEQRSEELALIRGLLHEKQIDPEIGSLLQQIKEHDNFEKLSFAQKRNIYLIQKEYDQQTKIPKELVIAIAKQGAVGSDVWKKALIESNYDLFKPELIKIFELIKKYAEYLAPDKNPFDVLIDLSDPGFNQKILDKLFSELRDGLIPLITKCAESPNQPDYSLIERNCPVEIQEKMSEDIMELIKYDTNRGRIDKTVHPFTTGFYDDVRITTKYLENDFTSNYYSVLHEGGHALYEQNMPKEYKYEPIGFCCSGGFHESQSRYIENFIGRSREFLEYYFPRLKEITGEIFADVKLEDFIRAVNRVTPSKIRVEADPVTYSLHVILRYEIERDLFSGKLSFDDLPKVWNQKMKVYLGVDIKNDAEGVLQDIHWSEGEFGTFPSYAIGNIIDGQLHWKLEQEIPNWKDQIRKGDLTKIISWLFTNVHMKGNLFDPLDLVKEITGEELSTKYYLEYLKKEYTNFYNL